MPDGPKERWTRDPWKMMPNAPESPKATRRASLIDLIGEPWSTARSAAPSTTTRRRACTSMTDHFHCFGCGAHGDSDRLADDR